MPSIGAGSRSGLGSGARGIAGARSALPRSGRSLARLGLGSRADLHGLLARGLHLGRDNAHGLGSRDLVEKALKVDLHVGNGKTK